MTLSLGIDGPRGGRPIKQLANSRASENATVLPFQFVLHHVLPELQGEGFCVPVTRAFEGRLAKDLDPLGQRPCPSGGPPQKLCSLMHLLNLLWQPILEHIDALSCGKAAPWTPGLAKNSRSWRSRCKGSSKHPKTQCPWMTGSSMSIKNSPVWPVPKCLEKQ